MIFPIPQSGSYSEWYSLALWCLSGFLWVHTQERCWRPWQNITDIKFLKSAHFLHIEHTKRSKEKNTWFVATGWSQPFWANIVCWVELCNQKVVCPPQACGRVKPRNVPIEVVFEQLSKALPRARGQLAKETRNNCLSKNALIVLNAATDPLSSCTEEDVLLPYIHIRLAPTYVFELSPLYSRCGYFA